MGKGIKNLWKGTAVFGLIVLLTVMLTGNVKPENQVSASDAGTVESNEISSMKGNGPQKVTSLKEFGIDETGITTGNGNFAAAFSEEGNKVQLTDIIQGVQPSGNKYIISNNTVGKSIVIDMEHDWTLNMDILAARCSGVAAAGVNIQLSSAAGTLTFGINRNSAYSTNTLNYGSSTKTILGTDFGKEKNNIISYNAQSKTFNWSFGDNVWTGLTNSLTAAKEMKLSINGNHSHYYNETWPVDEGTDADGSKYKGRISYVRFNSFQYTNYYLKAVNHISDYAGRPITGAVGSGNTVGVHPTILNDRLVSQRFSGIVELNMASPRPLSNMTLYGDFAAAPYTSNFTHDSRPCQDVEFKAKVTGNYETEAGKKFYLPLLVNDNYFGKNQELENLAAAADSGVPGTWHNLNQGGKDQLPLELNLERATYRKLISDEDEDASNIDYTHNIEPNERGWYNKDVILKLQNTDEFDELLASSADVTADDEDKSTITSANIEGTGKAGNSYACQFNGGSPSGETGRNGVTYSIFARKGDNNTTNYLSAVTSETYRIDKTAPVFKDADRKTRQLQLEDKPDTASVGQTDSQGNEVEGSGIAYVEWLTPSDVKNDVAWPSDDPGLFSSENGGWPSRTDKDRRIIPVAASADTPTGSASATVTMPSFDEEGTYIFRIVDLAGNVSGEKKISNHFPELDAKKAAVKYADTIENFVPKDVLKAKVSDQDETLNSSDISWKIERAEDSEYPAEFEKVSGQRNEALTDALPLGTYTVTISMIGTDSDGNVPNQNAVKEQDRNALRVTLTVTAGDPPVVNDSKTGDPVEPENLPVIKDDTSAHTIVTGKKILIVDPSNYYCGGKISGKKLQEEVEKYYDFTSLLKAPKDELKIKVTLYKDGIDYTSSGINTKTEGEYVIHYQAIDASGCSVTMQLTYQVRTDLNVTFHAGKGDFKEPSGTQTKTIRVKYGKAPSRTDIPGAKDILAPVERVFTGWGREINSAQVIDPDAHEVEEDVTYYAVYTVDENRDGIPDSEEAIFYFVSGDKDHLAFKYPDRTTVGIPVMPGASISLQQTQIPEILFDTSYRLKGWKTDLTGDELLTTEQLCQITRGRGSKITVTAIPEKGPEEYNDKITVTFFSSEPKLSPLKGGEGQTIILDAPKPGEPVTIPKEMLPQVNLGDKCQLEGWKTSDTGDLILETDDVASQKLYGGKELTCIAYVAVPKDKPVNEKDPAPDKKPDKDPEKDTDKENPGDNKKETAEKTINKVIEKKKVITKKEEEQLKDTVFIFVTSREESGSVEPADGTSVVLPAKKGGTVSITEKYVPDITLKKGSTFIGWRTSITGNRILSTGELCRLKVSAGNTVICTAYFKYEEVQVEQKNVNGKNKNTTKVLTSFSDEQSPLGGRSSGFGSGSVKSSTQCIVHYIMLVWLLLSVLTILWRIHSRKKASEYLYSGEAEFSAEVRTIEDYQSIQQDQRTGIRDYVLVICALIVGAILYTAGTCFLEIPVLAAQAAACALYIVRMKMLDYKDSRAVTEMENNG